MTDSEIEARALLAELQDVIAAKDLDVLSDLFADDVVLFGTDVACFGRDETPPSKKARRLIANDCLGGGGANMVARSQLGV